MGATIRNRGWGLRRLVLALGLVAALTIAVVLLVTRGDDGTVAPTATGGAVVTTVAAPGAPVPEPLARALDRLERATQP